MQHVGLPTRDEVRKGRGRLAQSGFALEGGRQLTLRRVELAGAEPEVGMLEREQSAKPGTAEAGNDYELSFHRRYHLQLTRDVSGRRPPYARVRPGNPAVPPHPGDDAPAQRGE